MKEVYPGISYKFPFPFFLSLPVSGQASGWGAAPLTPGACVLVVLIVNKRGAPSAAVGRRSQTKIERTLHTSGENFHSRIQSISRAEQIFWNPTRRLITTPEIEISAVRSKLIAQRNHSRVALNIKGYLYYI